MKSNFFRDFSIRSYMVLSLALLAISTQAQANSHEPLLDKSQTFISSLFQDDLRTATKMLSPRSIYREGVNLQEFRDGITSTYGDLISLESLSLSEKNKMRIHTVLCVFTEGKVRVEISYDNSGLVQWFTFKGME